MATYPRAGASEVPAQPDFPELERRALAYWNAHDTFKQSPSGTGTASSEFVFYDGPPFANGLPHYGHLLTGYVKDIVPRYKTMRGSKVDRRFGWDCHGLPAEVEAERLLGISGKADILKMGIETFNEACRDSVLRYTKEWEEYVTRQARWVDFENDYKTLDLPYMESVMWAFKQLHDKGLIYQGFKVLPVLLALRDPAVQPRAADGRRRLHRPHRPERHRPVQAGDRRVDPRLDHHAVDAAVQPGRRGRPGHHVRDRGNRGRRALRPGQGPAQGLREGARRSDDRSPRSQGSELLGRRYQPLFDYLTDTEKFGTDNAWRVIPSDEVTTEDGTGVVHMAPAYGEADAAACQAAGIPIVLTVDEQGKYLPIDHATGPASTSSRRTSDIVRRLREDNALVRRQTTRTPTRTAGGAATR